VPLSFDIWHVAFIMWFKPFEGEAQLAPNKTTPCWLPW
jgi:hypothetical protein